MTRRYWTQAETDKALALKAKGVSEYEIASRLGRTFNSVNVYLTKLKKQNKIAASRIPESTMPLWDKPLKSEGDALILSDIEAPFQHSDFINRCLDLADVWGIKTLHLAGDLLHYDHLSVWGSEWVQDKEEMLNGIMEIMETVLKERDRAKVLERLQDKGLTDEGGLSGELKHSRAVFRSLNSFDKIYVALGNHDDRYLRALNNALSPVELLHQLDRHADPRWKIAPYYFTTIETQGGFYRIEHPRGAGKNAAVDLAIQYHSHVLMGHSHR